ncbi:MAG: hypothetical protein D6780_03770 [Candidatus Dadabacteria bacterium]|nr:MAG: hypothetical protein D6780_03770 [Candidatus Dadabacteria bacterium]
MDKKHDNWIVIKGKRKENFSGTSKKAGDIFRDRIEAKNYTQDTLELQISPDRAAPSYPETKIETAGDLFRTPAELYKKYN